MIPKVFISYSWTSSGYQAQIRQWAEQMMEGERVDVILDQWELKEGDDKYAFMEKMVTDESVTHVLIFSDSEYTAKANSRKSGVGTESQIISNEIYSKVKQSKFIPIVCEFDDSREPYLPVFLKSRIWIDFSTPEAANENWERLIRLLYGEPAYVKPPLGKAPSFLSSNVSVPASPITSKFFILKQAIIQKKNTLKLYRQDFLDSCYSYADELRIRKKPDATNWGERVLEDCGKLKIVRDHLVDWIIIESEVNPSEEFDESVLGMLEKLLDLKSRPSEVNQWSDNWFEAQGVFVYETFLYIVASLMKTEAYDTLNLILTSHYLLPQTEMRWDNRFKDFGAFLGFSGSLQILAPEGKKLYAPAAELIKRQSDREDLPFSLIIEAELLVLLMAFISEDVSWFPQTLHYEGRASSFPFFIKATQHRGFKKLVKITGIEDVNELREAVKKGHERMQVDKWTTFFIYDRSFWESMNLDNMDTLK